MGTILSRWDRQQGLLLDPGGFLCVGSLEVDVKLLEGGLQGCCVAAEVGGDGIVEEQQLLVHHLHLARTQPTHQD